jgi:hypothetical protein
MIKMEIQNGAKRLFSWFDWAWAVLWTLSIIGILLVIIDVCLYLWRLKN